MFMIFWNPQRYGWFAIFFKSQLILPKKKLRLSKMLHSEVNNIVTDKNQVNWTLVFIKNVENPKILDYLLK